MVLPASIQHRIFLPQHIFTDISVAGIFSPGIFISILFIQLSGQKPSSTGRALT
jgi:hypothetical protein